MSVGYWSHIKSAANSLVKGLKITFGHLKESRLSTAPLSISDKDYFEKQKGLITVQYPHESLPVPDNGRYRLHNEIDDCIVCDKCAKICPVDCIEIEAIKAVDEIGRTSDGTPKRIYAAKFDINMGKCCFCGLCTTVCPTECLTMTKAYDFSEFEIENHTYSFATMSAADILAKQNELAAHEKSKTTIKREDASGSKPVIKPKSGGRPIVKPKLSKPNNGDN